MPNLDPEQRKIVRLIKAEGQQIRNPKVRRKYLKAAVETGLVESGLRNLSYGDADSAGWRQERASIYPNPTNVKASIRRFRQEFQQQYDPGEKSYQVAAQVQRPRADLRGRYRDVAPQAAQILHGTPGTSGGYRTIAGVDNSATRQQLMASYFATSHDPNALLQLKAGLDQAQDVPSRRVRIKGGKTASTSSPSYVEDVKAEADLIDAARVPYQWGGGHGKKLVRGSKVTPLDCSGAVSRVLGIDPRVSGQFESWGKPGRGRVTIYANAKHVLMEVDGHFFGTSASNPGGGAGWIKRSKISKKYLSQFVARHA